MREVILEQSEWPPGTVHQTVQGEHGKFTRTLTGDAAEAALVQSQVFEILNNAKENGYFELGELLHGATAEEVANDILAYADYLELTKEEMLPHIRKWLSQQEDNT